jgi:hypothetical protein
MRDERQKKILTKAALVGEAMAKGQRLREAQHGDGTLRQRRALALRAGCGCQPGLIAVVFCRARAQLSR